MTDSLPKDVAFVNPRAEHDFKGRTCSIVGVGSYVPERRLTNADLEEMVETSENGSRPARESKNVELLLMINSHPTSQRRRLEKR